MTTLPHIELPVSMAIVAAVALAALAVAAFAQARRWRAERRRLFDAERAFQAMTTGIVDFAVLLLDAEGRILGWNEAARRIEGYTDAEIVGCHFSAFYPPEDRAAGKPGRMLEAARREGRSRDEGWRVRRDGSRFWAEVMITAVRRADGSLHGFVKATRDLTERRRADDAARMESLSRRFLEADEARRRNLSRDLLDAIGATLDDARANVREARARHDRPNCARPPACSTRRSRNRASWRLRSGRRCSTRPDSPRRFAGPCGARCPPAGRARSCT